MQIEPGRNRPGSGDVGRRNGEVGRRGYRTRVAAPLRGAMDVFTSRTATYRAEGCMPARVCTRS